MSNHIKRDFNNLNYIHLNLEKLKLKINVTTIIKISNNNTNEIIPDILNIIVNI